MTSSVEAKPKTKSIYIGIIGSRRRDSSEDYRLVQKIFALAYLLLTSEPIAPGTFQVMQQCKVTVVSGGCKKGADRFAERLADLYGCEKLIHRPDESKLDPKLMAMNPRAAYAKINYARNLLVARDSKDLLIACVAPDRKGGTEHTIKEWKKLHPRDWESKLILV